MTCPIGVPGIAGKEPEVIAVAVAAQLLQLRAAEASRRRPHAARRRPMSGGAPRLRLSGIRKVYPAVVANDGIDLDGHARRDPRGARRERRRQVARW